MSRGAFDIARLAAMIAKLDRYKGQIQSVINLLESHKECQPLWIQGEAERERALNRLAEWTAAAQAEFEKCLENPERYKATHGGADTDGGDPPKQSRKRRANRS